MGQVNKSNEPQAALIPLLKDKIAEIGTDAARAADHALQLAATIKDSYLLKGASTWLEGAADFLGHHLWAFPLSASMRQALTKKQETFQALIRDLPQQQKESYQKTADKIFALWQERQLRAGRLLAPPKVFFDLLGEIKDQVIRRSAAFQRSENSVQSGQQAMEGGVKSGPVPVSLPASYDGLSPLPGKRSFGDLGFDKITEGYSLMALYRPSYFDPDEPLQTIEPDWELLEPKRGIPAAATISYIPRNEITLLPTPLPVSPAEAYPFPEGYAVDEEGAQIFHDKSTGVFMLKVAPDRVGSPVRLELAPLVQVLDGPNPNTAVRPFGPVTASPLFFSEVTEVISDDGRLVKEGGLQGRVEADQVFAPSTQDIINHVGSWSQRSVGPFGLTDEQGMKRLTELLKQSWSGYTDDPAVMGDVSDMSEWHSHEGTNLANCKLANLELYFAARALGYNVALASGFNGDIRNENAHAFVVWQDTEGKLNIFDATPGNGQGKTERAIARAGMQDPQSLKLSRDILSYLKPYKPLRANLSLEGIRQMMRAADSLEPSYNYPFLMSAAPGSLTHYYPIQGIRDPLEDTFEYSFKQPHPLRSQMGAPHFPPVSFDSDEGPMLRFKYPGGATIERPDLIHHLEEKSDFTGQVFRRMPMAEAGGSHIYLYCLEGRFFAAVTPEALEGFELYAYHNNRSYYWQKVGRDDYQLTELPTVVPEGKGAIYANGLNASRAEIASYFRSMDRARHLNPAVENVGLFFELSKGRDIDPADDKAVSLAKDLLDRLLAQQPVHLGSLRLGHYVTLHWFIEQSKKLGFNLSGNSPQKNNTYRYDSECGVKGDLGSAKTQCFDQDGFLFNPLHATPQDRVALLQTGVIQCFPLTIPCVKTRTKYLSLPLLEDIVLRSALPGLNDPEKRGELSELEGRWLPKLLARYEASRKKPLTVTDKNDSPQDGGRVDF